jgi:hypothetical protein
VPCALYQPKASAQTYLGTDCWLACAPSALTLPLPPSPPHLPAFSLLSTWKIACCKVHRDDLALACPSLVNRILKTFPLAPANRPILLVSTTPRSRYINLRLPRHYCKEKHSSCTILPSSPSRRLSCHVDTSQPPYVRTTSLCPATVDQQLAHLKL